VSLPTNVEMIEPLAGQDTRAIQLYLGHKISRQGKRDEVLADVYVCAR
jgi:hypothetical protein